MSALIGTDGFTVYRDVKAGHAWIFNGTTFWTLDDPAVLAQKTRYIRDNRLGGAMVWSLDEAATGADYVIEAVIEDLAIKQRLFAQAGAAAPSATLGWPRRRRPSRKIAMTRR